MQFGGERGAEIFDRELGWRDHVEGANHGGAIRHTAARCGKAGVMGGEGQLNLTVMLSVGAESERSMTTSFWSSCSTSS